MIDGIRFKVCGLTSLVDTGFVDNLGADALGFILYPKSPRYVSLLQYQAMAKLLPVGRKRVAVMVEPSVEELASAMAVGFDRFQIHFDAMNISVETVAAWSRQVSPERLWLAPKLPQSDGLALALLPLADTVLIDTFHAGSFGGSGKTGDWSKFAGLQTAHPDKTWILAGGISSENIVEALAKSEAKFVDVNSGVEAVSGVKDHAKLKQFVLNIHRSRMGGSAPSC